MAKKKEKDLESLENEALETFVEAEEVFLDESQEIIIEPNEQPKVAYYELLEDVKIGDKVVKKGTKYPLTKEGAKYFKSQFYIK